MTSEYVSSLMARLYKLDALAAQARLNRDVDAQMLITDEIEEVLYELDQATHMKEV